MRHWIDALAGCTERAVAVVIAEVEGSTPRGPGARMLVTAFSVEGTIGGGHLEHEAVRAAREALGDRARNPRALFRLVTGTGSGASCGGAASLVLERFEQPLPAWVAEAARRRAEGEVLVVATPIDGRADGVPDAPAASSEVPPREMMRLIGRRQAGCVAGLDAAPAVLRGPVRALIESADARACIVPAGSGMVLLERLAPDAFHVMLFGAGHVGQAMVAALGSLPCRVTWVDDREGQFAASIPANVRAITSSAPASEVAKAPAGTFFLVMTHSHALDQAICEAILRRDDVGYCGLIGSSSKRAMFERALAQRGIPSERFARLTCPIGISGIRGKEPAVIAVAVTAQLLQVREASAAGTGALSPVAPRAVCSSQNDAAS